MFPTTVLSLVVLAGSALADNALQQQCKAAFNAAGICLLVADLSKGECSSFMQTTVKLCPSTYTNVATTTVTAAAATTISTTSVTSLDTVTSTVTSTTTSFVDETFTIRETFTDRTTEDVPATLTNTQTITAATVTSTDTVIAAPTTVTITVYSSATKRRKKARRSIGDESLTQNNALACSPTTAAPTNVPWYAWICQGASQYASACSCAGVEATTTTFSSYSTVTAVSTIYTTPTSIATATVTSYTTATDTTTTVSTAIVTTTDTSRTSDYAVHRTSIITVTAAVVATSVITPPPVSITVTSTPIAATVTTTAACSAYHFVAVGGNYSGRYAYVAAEDATYQGVIFQTNPPPDSYVLQSSGQIVYDDIYSILAEPVTAPYLATWGSEVTIVIAAEPDNPQGYAPLICSVNTSQANLVAGSVGVLTCSYNSQPNTFYNCPGSAYLYQSPDEKYVG